MSEPQSRPYPVAVLLESVRDGQRSVIRASGEAVERGTQLYVRFEEKSEGPRGESLSVRTTIKAGQGELKLIRHGAVESKQTFREGASQPGFYRSPYTQFNLSTETGQLEMVRSGRSLQASWTYELYVYGEASGSFAISLDIQEEPK
ncbi:DUF1934 domain-containing protein [Paenibacillus spiritus]|uniref:DUF1934 domain-containing protein n=1 Tax=Paenibacillus spiritus TaxID=2496557 RepID=A0A5J5G9K1_9BACL|nr:DUF1934 domain-containing protein [Paenibacillus spiritus]KAA9004641.1 DUF1934 domain-containing protein [Paenibacillus spiritus]